MQADGAAVARGADGPKLRKALLSGLSRSATPTASSSSWSTGTAPPPTSPTADRRQDWRGLRAASPPGGASFADRRRRVGRSPSDDDAVASCTSGRVEEGFRSADERADQRFGRGQQHITVSGVIAVPPHRAVVPAAASDTSLSRRTPTTAHAPHRCRRTGGSRPSAPRLPRGDPGRSAPARLPLW